MIQTRLTSQLNHNLGLNPKAFRLIKQENSVKLSNAAKNVLDGELLSKFSSLSLSMRKELAKQIGSDHIQILQSLQEVDHATTVL
ncbi:hypothetical protein SARC_09802 [Sphaeroforma arctica JP610]|nr:hypothetical protein SARC_09802 [Sphaeroforma arctica JP610]KNC77748.1 hypothetical protein SARC_09802 [Sphaeroforma arctica JP610]|eukprot:XP_014151650.1 hypothetical protein SARC_09802 [Sphaeroforma arctica JP610]